MVIFSDIQKYGNMSYGNVFRNYYHISKSKYGKKKTYGVGGGQNIWYFDYVICGSPLGSPIELDFETLTVISTNYFLISLHTWICKLSFDL